MGTLPRLRLSAFRRLCATASPRHCCIPAQKNLDSHGMTPSLVLTSSMLHADVARRQLHGVDRTARVYLWMSDRGDWRHERRNDDLRNEI